MIKDLNNPEANRTLQGVNIKPGSEVRRDSWSNALIGLGKRNIDKTMTTEFGTMTLFTDEELSEMYGGEGLGKRIIDLRPKDATRAWINIPSDPDDIILKELKRLDAKATFKKALSWARLYRGAIIVIIEEGATDLTRPLPKKIRGIRGLRVYSAARIDLSESDIVTKARSPYFDEVELFPIRMRNGSPMYVHASRCLVFKGEEGPDEGILDFKYKYWGLPIMMQIYDRLKNFGSVEQSIVNLMLEFNIGKYTLANLTQMLSSNDDATLQLIYDRMDIINASKSQINAVLLGEGEEYSRDSATVSGVDSILDRLMIFLSAAAGYPVTRLWGRSPAGENATGAFDMRQYYDDVSSDQELQLEQPLQKVVNIIGGYSKIKNPDLVFNPLWQPTKEEQSKIDENNAKSDKIYIEAAVFSPEEIRRKRLESYDTPKKGSII